MSFLNARRMLVAATAAVAFVSAAQAADISGAGATFPTPIYSKWADAYKKQTGVGLNYQSIGSGGGIKQIKAKTVTFGASDMPLKPDDVKESGLVQFPMIIGGAVPAVNIELIETLSANTPHEQHVKRKVRPGQLVLDGATIASIYLGEITKWNDPRIKKLNPLSPNLALPDTAIAPIYRSDGSGTNFLFSDYLSKSSPKFKETIGANSSVQWPTGIGAKGNEGLANMVGQTDGSIGYVEYAYAKQNNMAYTQLINKDGKAVTPSGDTFAAAAANADWAHAPAYYLILTDQSGAKSWPITGASFILVYAQPQDLAATTEALKFFNWAYKSGMQMASELDYVPLPESVIKQVRATWKSEIKGIPALSEVQSAAKRL